MNEAFAAKAGARPYGSGSNMSTGTDACRYLAAAPYHDGNFRQEVLEYVRHRWYRAPAPEFGIDEALVHEHCWRADFRQLVRNQTMLLVFFIGAAFPIAKILETPTDAAGIIGGHWPVLIFAWSAAAAVLFAERLHTEHFLIAKQFSRDRFVSSGGSILSDVETQNLVVYGGYNPFVGSGNYIGGWSFSVNLEHTKEEFGKAVRASPFEAQGLLAFIRQRIDRLRNNNLRYREVLFADGRLLRENPSSLMQNGLPRRRISAEMLGQLSDSLDSGTRSYLGVHIADWGGEIVISIYLRCTKYESSLFVEASLYLLPPPKRSFFRIDEAEPELRPGAIVRLLATSLLSTPFVIAGAAMELPVRLFAPISHWMERRRIRRAIKRNPRFNFGAVTSIRELGMENLFRVYFQALDRDRYVKTVEQCAIDAIVEFLDAHDIDTSDINGRREAVLNTGVIVSGGNFNAGNVAVGNQAKALISNIGAKMGIGGSAQKSAKPAGAS